MLPREAGERTAVSPGVHSKVAQGGWPQVSDTSCCPGLTTDIPGNMDPYQSTKDNEGQEDASREPGGLMAPGTFSLLCCHGAEKKGFPERS